VHIRDNLDLAPNAYRITLHDVVVGEGECLQGRELAINPGQASPELEGVHTKDPTFGLDAVWIDPSQRAEAQSLGFTVVDNSTIIATHLSQILKNNAHKLLGQDDVQLLLDKLARSSPKLVENLVPNTMSLGEVTRVLQALLEEGVPVRDMRNIAETLASAQAGSQDSDALLAQVRVALGPSIYQIVAGTAPELKVLALDSQLEQILQNSVQGAGGGLEPSLLNSIMTQLSEGSQRLEAEGAQAVLLVGSGIRMFLARLLRGRISGLYVLAYEEIPPSKSIKVVATIGGNQRA